MFPFELGGARVHEAEGRGRRSFALCQAQHHSGPVFYITLQQERERLMCSALPEGLAGRLCLVRTRSTEDLLWATEEVLRDPAPGLVIAEPDRALHLNAARRLQLAAEAGQTTGLLLIREGQGSNVAETRWHCKPVPGGPDQSLHHWEMLRNKRGPCRSWTLSWDGRAPLKPEDLQSPQQKPAPDPCAYPSYPYPSYSYRPG
ncbi:ImuA family protein [Falsigemmobacter intermedius]|uniref:Uncharacterized protein n=1 Tax=Falsigemmobacter intermedius TaxID=1553448 RepID=A0A444MG00_9RHOB|nr:hypothetical protein [Falsigemmobacter intermedius]RWY44590.1 hypothetical protein EP867_01175 [Falsigemmobacter intermedius]